MDWLRESVTDTIRPFRDSAITVRRRWYPVGDDAPPMPFPSAFLSARWEPYPYLPRNVGEVYGAPIGYPQAGTPAGLPTDHVCGTEDDFRFGAIYDPAVNVTYNADGLPTCCGVDAVCVNQLCGSEPLNDYPAAQLRSYPVANANADGTTPVTFEQWAWNLAGTDPRQAGYVWRFNPGGEDNGAKYVRQLLATAAGELASDTTVTTLPGGLSITEIDDATGRTLRFQEGVSFGAFTFRYAGGVLELCGANARICPDILPPFEAGYEYASLNAAGTTQGTATPITTASVYVATAPAGSGLRLPPNTSPTPYPTIIRISNGVPDPVNIYPDSGGAFLPDGTNNVPWVLEGRKWVVIAKVLLSRWVVVATGYVDTPPPPPPPPGTVTSVGLVTSSSSLAIADSPVTSAGNITLDLDPALDALPAATSTGGIVASDGAGGWLLVGIGSWLDYSAGTLSVTPPTATAGVSTGATFAITGTSGTFQATGLQVALPAAGTYLVTCDACATLTPGATEAQRITGQLRNNTAGAFISNSEFLISRAYTAGVVVGGSGSITIPVTVAAPTTLELYACRTGTSWTTSSITSDTAGRTRMSYTRLS